MNRLINSIGTSLTKPNSQLNRGGNFGNRIKPAPNKELSVMLASEYILIDISRFSCSPNFTNISQSIILLPCLADDRKHLILAFNASLCQCATKLIPSG